MNRKPRSASQALNDVIEAYAELEEGIHARISEVSGPICATCDSPCCTPFHCRDATESAWLRAVAKARGREIVLQKRDETSFITDKGCALKAGWPPQCTWYVCDELERTIRNPLERYVYQVLCSALGHVIRNIKKDTDLTNIEDLNLLTDKQIKKIGKRINEAGLCAELAWNLRQEKNNTAKVDDTAKGLLRIARQFPFAASCVRFEEEPPSLSKASRRRRC